MSKALDIAHSSQEKCKKMEKETNQLFTNLESIKGELEQTIHNLQSVEREKKDLKEKIKDLEKEILQV